MNCIIINGQLRSALDDAGAIALRLAAFLERLAELDPLFGGWRRIAARNRSAVAAIVTLPPDETELRRWVEEGARFGPRDGRKQCIGYLIRAATPETNPIYADFWLSFDSSSDAWSLTSHMGLTLVFAEGVRSRCEDQAIVKNSIAFFRASLLALALAWDCEWAAVMPGDFRWEGEHPPDVPINRYKGGWMVYVDSALAAGLAEPQDVEIEKLPNGGVLLTAVSDALFYFRNPIHRAAALRIQAALAPLNDAQNARNAVTYKVTRLN